MQEVDQLIEALNPRGHRESSLKEALQQERERLQQVLQGGDRNKYSHTGTHANANRKRSGFHPLSSTVLW